MEVCFGILSKAPKTNNIRLACSNILSQGKSSWKLQPKWTFDRAPVLVGWRFGVWWVLASIVGWAVGSVVSDTVADVVLSAHDHTYERFSPQSPTGQAEPTRGIRQFVVGTGGASFYSFPSIQPNSEVRNNTTWGVLKLTLHPTSYDWEFVPIAGQTFTDSGSASCVVVAAAL